MLYLAYEESKARFAEAQRTYSDIVDRLEELFARTQPNAVTLEKDKVTGGKITNDAFADYVIAKERGKLDERLQEAKTILDHRRNLLAMQEYSLAQSVEIYDMIYYRRYVKRRKVYQIAKETHYSERQIYRMVSIIDRSVKTARSSQSCQ